MFHASNSFTQAWFWRSPSALDSCMCIRQASPDEHTWIYSTYFKPAMYVEEGRESEFLRIDILETGVWRSVLERVLTCHRTLAPYGQRSLWVWAGPKLGGHLHHHLIHSLHQTIDHWTPLLTPIKDKCKVYYSSLRLTNKNLHSRIIFAL